MRYILLSIVCGCLLSSQVFSQSETPAKPADPDYKTAIGVRFSSFGVSFKSNLELKKRSFEIVGYFKDGFTASLLYYWNFALTQQKNLKLYVGGAGQAGFRNSDAGGGAVLGVGGVVGADYKFLHLPLNLSLDWQPSFQFGKDNDFKGYGGIAVRFTL